MFYRRNGQPDLPDLMTLSGAALEDEKTRLEVAQLRLELQEERSWRSKLIVTTLLSVLIPFGGALAFLNTWFGARMGDRKSAQDTLYADAAKNLSNQDASVRLNAVTTLDSFLHPAEQSWLRQKVNSLIGRGDENPGDDASGCEAVKGPVQPAAIRSCEMLALLIGRLSEEGDPAR